MSFPLAHKRLSQGAKAFDWEDLVIEVVKYYPAYTWAVALEECSLILARLFAEIPDIHLKKAWPVMQLMALVGNAVGGKGDSGAGEKVDPKKMFSPADFTPHYAHSADAPAPVLEPQHCWAFQQALEAGELEGASWVLHVIEREDNLERVARVGEAYGELLQQSG